MKLKPVLLPPAGLLLAGALWIAAPAHAALTINPVFPDTFTCTICGLDPATVVSLNGDAQVQGAVVAAAHQVASQFNNPVTANLLFYGVHAGPGGFLAASVSGQTLYSYGQFRTALGADAAAKPHNLVLNSAFNNLGFGNGANDPNADVVVNTTDARVLGLGNGVDTAFGTGDETPQFDATGGFVGGHGFADAFVLVNLDAPFAFSRPLPSASTAQVFDAQSSVEHEIDETMGVGGAGSQLNLFNAVPNYSQVAWGVNAPVFGVMDLYRYAAPGVPSFDPTNVSITGCTNLAICTGAPSPYFSVDGGATGIDEFNQAFPLIGGDAGDWGLDLFESCPGNDGVGGAGDVQDAFSCNNRSPDVRPGTPVFAAFQAIGYNPVPEPAEWVVMILGLGAAGVLLRRRRSDVSLRTAEA